MEPSKPTDIVQFPSYHPPGTPVAEPGFHKPLYKMMKLAMRKGRTRRMPSRHKGILVSPDVHITERKVKWY